MKCDKVCNEAIFFLKGENQLNEPDVRSWLNLKKDVK